MFKKFKHTQNLPPKKDNVFFFQIVKLQKSNEQEIKLLKVPKITSKTVV